MRSFWSDPYLWIHVAGLAALPILLEVCALGLAVGDPLLPPWLEFLFVAVVGIAPVLWMQWQRPFYIFSFLAVAVKPERLSLDQQRLLRLFKAPENRVLAVLSPIFLGGALWQIYLAAPMAAEVAPFSPEWRGAGLLLAAIAFLGSNLFLQVPVSVIRVLLASEQEFAATEPYPVDKVSRDLTILGWRVNQILPVMTSNVASDLLGATTTSETSGLSSVSSNALEADLWEDFPSPD